jgi:rRNA-processing protein FCF1
VLDTNALLLPFTSGTRLEDDLDGLLEQWSLHVPTSVVSELKHLSENRGKTGHAAKAALKLAARLTSEATGRMGDDGILEVARRLGAVVVTGDRKLQAECQRSGLRVIVARERGRLAFAKSGSG